MAKVFIEESTLTNIGNAIRNKTGKSDLLSPATMPTEIEAIQTGGGSEEELDIVLTGNCQYALSNAGWMPALKYISTSEITDASHMCDSCKTESYPFEFNFGSSPVSVSYLLGYNSELKTMPKLNNLYADRTDYMFASCRYLRSISDDRIDVTDVMGSYRQYMFGECCSIREYPKNFLRLCCQRMASNTASRQIMNGCFYNCYALDEITDFYAPTTTLTSNAMSQFISNTVRLKRFTFEAPVTRNWKSQTLDLSESVGYASFQASALTTYGGFTDATLVTDDASYQALKDNPDYYTTDVAYSRYNHDSAVETINSLPDCSAYGINTIKFKGTSGSATDGGAINTLTEEEIAVASAKGWTVTLV